MAERIQVEPAVKTVAPAGGRAAPARPSGEAAFRLEASRTAEAVARGLDADVLPSERQIDRLSRLLLNSMELPLSAAQSDAEDAAAGAGAEPEAVDHPGIRLYRSTRDLL